MVTKFLLMEICSIGVQCTCNKNAVAILTDNTFVSLNFQKKK